MVVVVLNARLHDAFEVASVDDQEPVEAFAAKGADETLRLVEDMVRRGPASAALVATKAGGSRP
jgi:hypothetical protein